MSNILAIRLCLLAAKIVSVILKEKKTFWYGISWYVLLVYQTYLR